MKRMELGKRLIALAAVAGVGFSAAGNMFSASVFAQTGSENGVVWQQVSEDRDGFAMSVNGAAEGKGVTLTQEASPFDFNYLAVTMNVSYVVNESGDEYFPVKIFINGSLLAGTPAEGGEVYFLEAYDDDGKTLEVEQKYGGYIFLPPAFAGTLYFPKALLNETSEISQIRVTYDGTHDGELVLLNVYGCERVGDKLGEPVVNRNNLKATTDEGISLSDGFVVEKKGGAEGNGIHLVQDAVDFDSKYLGMDVTVTEAGQPGDAYLFIKLSIGGKTVVPESGTRFPVSCRDDGSRSYIENLFGGWFVIPAGFDGTVYIDAETYLKGTTSVSALDILFDGGHDGKLTINDFFGCENVGASFHPAEGVLFEAGENASITAEKVENTAGNTFAKMIKNPPFPIADEEYLAVKIKMLSCSAVSDFTYIQFSVNDRLLTGDSGAAGEIAENLIDAVPADGTAIKLEQKWGNWIVIPSEFDGVIYMPVAKYCAGIGGIGSFSFLFDGGHTNSFEYAIGAAESVGAAPRFLSLNEETEKVKEVARLGDFKAESAEIVSVFDLSSFKTTEGGAISDPAVVCDEGVQAFDSYSYSYSKFGGVSVDEGWENQLMVHIKSQFEGGKPMNPTDNKDAYGYLEFSVADPFALSTGLTVNVQCISAECYFNVLLIDENGGVWNADYSKTDYTFVSDGAPVGIATLYDNFFFGEDSYGTLYIPKEYFHSVASYQGEPVEMAAEMGKIEKIVFSFDMLYGLGRTMSVGKICDADIDTEKVTCVFDPSQMTDEQLGIGTAKGTAVACNTSQAHADNFALRRETKEETPGYVEPERPGDSSSSQNSASESTGGSAVPANGCKSGCKSGVSALGIVGAAVCLGFIVFKKAGKKE